MRKSFFKEFAKKVDGKFYFQDADIAVGGGVRSPNVVYLVKFSYKDCEISVLNSTGTSFVGNITCKLAKGITGIPFEITSISHLSNLFRRKKSRFVIKSKNENIAYFLEQNQTLKELSTIAQAHKYSPWMVCDTDENKLVTKYHLEFDDWTQVIEPTVQLYKELIDEFEKRIAHLNHAQYRSSI